MKGIFAAIAATLLISSGNAVKLQENAKVDSEWSSKDWHSTQRHNSNVPSAVQDVLYASDPNAFATFFYTEPEHIYYESQQPGIIGGDSYQNNDWLGGSLDYAP